MILKSSNPQDIKPFLEKVYIPSANSHKGMNGKGLIVGGSSLFHSASLWSAEIASHFLDMVHYSSTEENNQIFITIKSQFRNGIVVHKKDLLHYVEEDDAILIGPGMVRNEKRNFQFPISNYEDILKIKDEAEYTYHLTHFLLHNYPEKRFVIDAGALQMMEKEWLKDLKQPAIITPHQGEFQRLFGQDVSHMSIPEKQSIVQKTAQEYNCILLLKAITDIISDGDQTILVKGGNPGLTKGGSGDILAGLALSFYAKTDPFTSTVLASFLEKRAADALLKNKAYWYNMGNLIDTIPEVFTSLLNEKEIIL